MVKEHHVRVYKSEENLPREDQLAWKIAEVAADPVEVDRRGHRHGHQPGHRQRRRGDRVAEPRARSSRPGPRRSTHAVPAPAARARRSSASSERVSPRVGRLGQRRRGARARLPRHLPGRRLLAPGRQHPADPRRRPARRLQRPGPGPRHRHRLRDPGRPGARPSACTSTRSTTSPTSARPPPPASAPCSGLDVETIFQAVGQALHTTTATRQSRKGEISTWKAHAPAFAGKMAVEAVDRAMRGETSPGADLRGRGRRHRLAARRPGRLLRGAAARRRARPSAPSWTPTPRSTRPSTRRRPGSTWPASCTASTPRLADPANVESIVHPHQPPHPLRDRLRRERPAEVRPDGQPRDAGPLDPVHLHRRPAGRRLAPRRLLRPRARRPRRTPWSCGTRSPPSRTRSGPAATTPTDSTEKAFGGRVEITLDRRHRHRRRDRRRRRAPARRPAVRPRAVRQQVPHPRRRPGRRRPRSSGSSPPPQRLPELAAGELDQLNIQAADRRASTVAAAPKGLF